MGKKLSLNEEKFKVAFIFLNEGCNPKKDRSVIESKKIILYSVGCADYSQAETVAQEMLEKVALLLIYAVLSEMKVLPVSAKPLIEKYQ